MDRAIAAAAGHGADGAPWCERLEQKPLPLRGRTSRTLGAQATGSLAKELSIGFRPVCQAKPEGLQSKAARTASTLTCICQVRFIAPPDESDACSALEAHSSASLCLPKPDPRPSSPAPRSRECERQSLPPPPKGIPMGAREREQMPASEPKPNMAHDLRR